jgi:hypothetical protein
VKTLEGKKFHSHINHLYHFLGICFCIFLSTQNSDTDVLAFDMEMYNPSAHTCITCLFQLATVSKTYIIDVLIPEVWNLVSLLAPIFADSNVRPQIFPVYSLTLVQMKP